MGNKDLKVPARRPINRRGQLGFASLNSCWGEVCVQFL